MSYATCFGNKAVGSDISSLFPLDLPKCDLSYSVCCGLEWEHTSEHALSLPATEGISFVVKCEAGEIPVSLPNTSAAVHNVGNWTGNHGFQASFEEQHELKKNMTWTYSESLCKLYVTLCAVCPIHFNTTTPPPIGSVICVVPVYKDCNSRKEAVRCCPVHAAGSQHWVRCDHPAVRYWEDVDNGNRQFLTVPYEAAVPQNELRFTYRFKFMCRSSCPGGPNRRQTQVLFILKSPDGEDLARLVFDVKVCASPGRDRWRDEEKVLPRPPPTKTDLQQSTPGSSTGRGGSGTKYIVFTKSKSVYKQLLRLREGCELRECIKKRKYADHLLDTLQMSSSESSSEDLKCS